ncbi:MAG: response regulator transcription factor [Roseivirga sp.]|nr:response regulator transcription factor [Roseivirga sp.]
MKKVLIIEDNVMMRLFLSNYLGNSYEVTAVESPQQAQGFIGRAEEFSLVLSDYYAPASEEHIALKRVQTAMAWQGVPMVILTDEHKSEQRIAAFQFGAQDCVSKPFNPLELSLRLKSIVIKNDIKAVYRPVA